MKEKSKQKTCLAVLASAVVFLTGSLTALAYVPPQTMEFSEYNPDIEVERCFETEDINAEPLLYDCFWVNSDGTIEEIRDYELEVKGSCSHVYKDGKYSEHKKIAVEDVQLLTGMQRNVQSVVRLKLVM